MVPDEAFGQQMLRERRRMNPHYGWLGHVLAGTADLQWQSSAVETDLTTGGVGFSFQEPGISICEVHSRRCRDQHSVPRFSLLNEGRHRKCRILLEFQIEPTDINTSQVNPVVDAVPVDIGCTMSLEPF